MKNSTLIALHEANELPETLLKEWSNKSHATPIADAQHEITKHEGSMLTGTFLMGMGIFAMGGIAGLLLLVTYKRLEISEPIFHLFFLWFLLFGLLIFIAAVILFIFSIESPSDFGTQLEKLRNVLGLTYGEMRALRLEKLKEQAEKTLYEQAEYVKNLQGPKGENSLSDDAKGARVRYEEMHNALFVFGLCEEKWDKYWKTPEPEKEVASGTA